MSDFKIFSRETFDIIMGASILTILVLFLHSNKRNGIDWFDILIGFCLGLWTYWQISGFIEEHNEEYSKKMGINVDSETKLLKDSPQNVIWGVTKKLLYSFVFVSFMVIWVILYNIFHNWFGWF